MKRARWLHRKPIVLITTVAVLSTLLAVVVPPVAAHAVGTVLFENKFNNRTVDGTGTVTKPNTTAGTNQACLTATGNSATLPLLSCASTSDTQGSGKLRFTDVTTNQVGGVFGATSFPSSNGLDVTFNTYQWGGPQGADGLGFVLAAVDPANPVPPTSIGPSGGSLGYSPAGSISGLTNAYLGVGLDVYGNFSSTAYQGTGCTNAPNIVTQVPGAVVVRGPGNVRVGYCGLTTTWTGAASSKVILRAATRAASVVPVQVLINPTSSTFTSSTGVSVSPGTYKVVFTPVGGSATTLTGALPAAASSLYPSTSWTSSNGVPKQLSFGFVGSTGSVTDAHEIDTVKVLTFNPVPQLAVSTTSYVVPAPAQGAPVNYVITPSILPGSDENNAISVTQTTPVGVVPVGAFGTGWTCLAPVGRTVTCTTTATTFTNGTTLPPVNVVAIVTGSGMTLATVQNSSVTTVSSTDANPATDVITTAGTVPAAPSGVTVTPVIGAIAGGGPVTVSGSSSTGPTAVEIGTVAEQQAGTPVVLLQCQGAATVGCFTISGSTLAIASLPARASAAAVTVTIVTLGIAGATNYTYADKPVTIATPTATAGITSSTLSWVAPDPNGSPITSYVVTPWLNGVLQSPVTFDASTTTRTFTGLTAGGSYRYTVQAVNAYGTSAASPQSAAVIPYNLPGAPVTSAATAGTQQATLTWSTPASNGSAITGYVVTPYLSAVAQTAQTFTSTDTTQTVTGLTAGVAYTFTVAAQNLAGTGPPSAKSPAVTPNASPTLTFAAPPAGEVGASYSTQLTVNNGTGPFTWSIANGTLPAGLTLPSSGLLSGTPTASGSFPVTVRVVDGSGQSVSRALVLAIAAAPLLTFTPADGEVSLAYNQQPTITGGTGPFAYALSAGSLPAALSLNASTGVLSGTPTVAGTYTFTLRATDAFSQVATRTVTLVVVALPTFGVAAPTVGQVGVPYSDTYDVIGGSLPLVWSISAGALPAGLTLNSSTGVVSGNPTTAGSSAITVLVVDARGQTASRALTVVIGVGPLVITKTANASSVVPGAVVAYTITITNSSSTPFTGVSFSDPLAAVLDDAVYNTNAAASTGTTSYASSTLGWTGNVVANGTVTITYSVTVANPDVGNKVLSNSVSSPTSGTNCATGTVDTRCTATVTVSGLTITKSADAATTTPGSLVRFSVLVTNNGQTAYTGATFTDTLAGVLDDASYNGDAASTAGSLSYGSPALTWTGNLAVGASVTVTYSVTVANPDNGNKSLTGTVVSPTAGSSCPSGNPAASCSVTVTVLIPALAIATVAGSATTTPGATVGYTQTLSNTGQTAYTGISLTIALAGALDDATWANNATASSGSLVYTAGTGSLVWTGNLALGAVVTITESVVVRNPDPADKAVTATVTSAAPGSSCPVGTSNSACSSTAVVLVPALVIAKSADVSSTTPGSVVRYTITVTNTGQTAYTGATFTDSLAAPGVLDDATYAGNAAATSGAVSYSAQTLSWTGNLAVAASATITYSVTVGNPATGNKTLSNTVVSTTAFNNCLAASVDPRCTSSVGVLIPGLSITALADAASTTPGAVVGYTVTAVNTGQTPYAGARITLDLAGALDDADYNFDATVTTGSLVTNPDGTVDWVLDLAVAAQARGTVSLTVKSPAVGDKSLRVTAVSNAPGSSCATGSSVPGCSSTIPVLIPGLVITKTANVSSVTTGGTVMYTVVVANTGQTPYPAASFDDSLAQVLTDAVYPGGATATSGTVSYAGSTLSWSGALAPDATATISYAVVVRDPDPGDKRMTNTVVSAAAGNNCTSGSTDPRCTVSVSVLVPGLTIAKTANVSSTVPGGSIAYVVTVRNSGATAYAAAAFTDGLASPGVLDDATYNGNAAATSGSVTLTGTTLGWSGALAVGATATITYSVTVRAANGGDNLVSNTVTSSSAGNNCPAAGSDPRCTVVIPVARLDLTQTVTEATTTPGATIHLSQIYTNTGQVPSFGISVTSPRADTSDDTVPTGDQVASSGTLVRTDAALIWTGNIPVGGSVTITRTLVVKNPDPGNQIITATLNSAAPGNNCATGTTDPRCTFTSTVLTPRLTITKTADTTNVSPGGTAGFTITITNSGQTTYVGATVSDTLAGVLDDATYPGNASASSGSVTYQSPVLTWTGNLAVGATATVTYSVTASTPGLGDKTMVNPVSSADVGSTCPPASSNSACRATVAVLTPGLTITNDTDVTSPTLGSAVVYTVVATNTGQTPYTSANVTESLSDVLDDATVTTTAAATRGTVFITGGVLSWSGGLAVGQNVVITFTVTIKNPDTGNQVLLVAAVSTTTGSNCPTASTDSRCAASITVVNSTTVTFTKTADVESAAPGRVVHYTVRAVNVGLVAVPVSFVDPLSGVLDDATYGADAAATAGTVTFAASTLSWNGGTLAPGATASVSYSVTVKVAIAGDQLLTNTVLGNSATASNNCGSGSSDARCTSTVTISRLDIQQAYTETTTTPGSLVHLSATFTNTGSVAYEGITVTSPSSNTVDDATATGDQTATSGSLSLGPTAITWTGNIAVGATVTISGTLTVQNPDLGNKLLTGTLVTTAIGSNCGSGSVDVRCTAALPVRVPGLTITKTADVTFVVPNGVVTYTIAVQNTGETAYVGAVVTDSLSGALDDATYNANATATVGGVTAGTVAYASPTLSWTGDLAVGATATITYTMTARRPAVGDKSMINVVSSAAVGSSCPPGGVSPACTSSVDVRTPALTTVVTANSTTAGPGDVVSYTVVVSNTGQTSYNAANVTAPLAGLTDDASYGGGASASSGSVVLTGSNLVWTGALAIGAAATITYAVTVRNPVPGDHLLGQTVTSTNQGTTCPVGGNDPRCATSIPIASLQIQNVADVTTTKPTGVVHYTSTFANTGQVAYVGITIIIDVAGDADDASYNGDGAATSGDVTITPGARISWTGDLPVGATAVFTGSVTVKNPDLGDHQMISVITTTAPASNCAVGSTDRACTSAVSVLTPGLTISKTADRTTATPGATVGYTVTVRNTGQTPYTAATVRDSLDGGANGQAGDGAFTGVPTATLGSVVLSGDGLTWTGDLAVGAVAVVSYSVLISSPDLGDKLLVNEVTSDELGSSCPTGGSDPACTVLVTVVVPALNIQVTANATTTTPGSVVGYTVVVRNTGQTDYAGASVTVGLSGVLDDAAYAGDASSTLGGSFGFTTSSLTWTGDLTAGATTTLTYSVTVADPDAGNKTLSTSVTSPAAGSTCTVGAPCVNSVSVLVPGLAVFTTANVSTATPGDSVTFTITVQNTGQTPYGGALLSTDLSRLLDDSTFDGVAVTSVGTTSYAAPRLSWNASLALGATATISYVVVVRSPDPGNKSLVTTVVADGAGSSCATGSVNPSCTATVAVLIPALSIAKSASVATVTPGGTVGYSIGITNSGQTPYVGAVVSDSLIGVLSDATYNSDAVVIGGGVLAYAGSTLRWTGNLPVGATATITYSVTVLNPDPGDKLITNTVVSLAAGSSCTPGGTSPACSAQVSVLVPALGITQTADVSTVVAGSTVHYTVLVSNTGQTDYAPATFSDSLAGILDDATYGGDAVATNGTLSYTNSTLVWTGALAAGASTTITFSVTALFPALGDHVLGNTVLSASAGSTCVTGSQARCRTAVTVLVPALSITKFADASGIVAGGTLGYTILARNTGQAAYPTAALTDSMAGLLDDAVYNGDATASLGTVGVVGGTLSWTGALPAGASVLISYSVTVNTAGAGDQRLTNAVSSSAVGSTCLPGTQDPRCVTTTAVTAASLLLSGLTPSFTLTGPANGTVALDNAVVMTVGTNNFAGYSVTVQAASPVLTGRPGNPDTIPIDRLRVRPSGTSVYTPLSSGSSVLVHTQALASAPAGDAVGNDYQVTIPFVASDEYSTSLDYLVTAQ